MIATSYECCRLGFRAEYIEPLKDEEEFEIHTPEGVYRMTKAQFYSTFDHVTRTMSYAESGLFTYAKTPKKALAYLLLGAPTQFVAKR